MTCNNQDPSPAVMMLYSQAEAALDAFLERGETPPMPEWILKLDADKAEGIGPGLDMGGMYGHEEVGGALEEEEEEEQDNELFQEEEREPANAEERQRRETQRETRRRGRLAEVFASRCVREEKGFSGVCPILESKLAPFFTSEKKTRWPWVRLPHWTFDIVNQPEAQRNVDMSKYYLLEEQLEEEMQLHQPTLWQETLKARSMNESAIMHQLQQKWQYEDDVEAGRIAKPEGWPDAQMQLELLRSLDIDPTAPLTPIIVGEGRDIWGVHPIDKDCGNTYCTYCYSHDWTGDPADNPKFKGRELIDLSNKELHELGQNQYYNSVPRRAFTDPAYRYNA